MTFNDLPTLNACLNGLSVVLMTSGFVCVKRGAVEAHKKLMVAALVSSAVFLTSYLVYHFNAGRVSFPGTGAARMLYLTILLTHTVLAIAIVPMVMVTVLHAVRDRLEKHKKWARVTLPIWWYVSVTGVVIYSWLNSYGAYDG